MTEKDSDNSNTDDEESEVTSVKQTIEVSGETLEEDVLIPKDEEEAKKCVVFTSEIKVTKRKEEKEEGNLLLSRYNCNCWVTECSEG